MSENENSKINAGHTLGDEEKMHDEIENVSKDHMLTVNPNEFTTHQYKLENSSCNDTTGE